MPSGVYDRTKAAPRKPRAKKGADAAPTTSPTTTPGAGEPSAPKKRRATRGTKKAKPVKRPRPAPASLAKFAVWSDGTVQIDAPECKGNLSGQDVDALYAYVKRLKGE